MSDLNPKYFEVSVSFNQEDDNGVIKKQIESYLFDAQTYTEAEARAYEYFKDEIPVEFKIEEIKKTKILDVFLGYNEKPFFKAKIEMVIEDSESGKIRKVNHFYLLDTQDIEQAVNSLRQNVPQTIIPYEITSIQKVNLKEVLMRVN